MFRKEELLKALKTDDSSTVSRLVSYSISVNELVFLFLTSQTKIFHKNYSHPWIGNSNQAHH